MSDLPRDRHFHSKPQVLLKVPVKMKGGRSKSHLLQLLPCVSFPWCVRGGPGWFVHRPRHPPTGSRAQPELTSGLGLPNQLRHSLKITESYLALTVMGMYSFLCCLVQRRVPRRQFLLMCFCCTYQSSVDFVNQQIILHKTAASKESPQELRRRTASSPEGGWLTRQ